MDTPENDTMVVGLDVWKKVTSNPINDLLVREEVSWIVIMGPQAPASAQHTGVL